MPMASQNMNGAETHLKAAAAQLITAIGKMGAGNQATAKAARILAVVEQAAVDAGTLANSIKPNE